MIFGHYFSVILFVFASKANRCDCVDCLGSTPWWSPEKIIYCYLLKVNQEKVLNGNIFYI